MTRKQKRAQVSRVALLMRTKPIVPGGRGSVGRVCARAARSPSSEPKKRASWWEKATPGQRRERLRKMLAGRGLKLKGDR